MDQLERRFHQAMVSIYTTAKRELGYNATRFLQMLSEQGGLATAKQLLWDDSPSAGFTTLWERGRLDLTVEAKVVAPEYAALFTEADLDRARDRLKAYGWDRLATFRSHAPPVAHAFAAHAARRRPSGRSRSAPGPRPG